MAGMPWDDYAAETPQAPADEAPPWADYAQQDQPAPQAGGMAGALVAAQPQLPNRTAGQWATDIGGSVGRGAYNLFDSLAGLGDIATGGEVTPWLAQHGLDSKAARQVLEDEMSPQAKASRDAVHNAQGFGPTVQAMAQNPDYAVGQVIESVPTMVVGGVAGKGAALGARAAGLNAGRAAVVGAGTGEGLAAAGGQAANTVQQTGGLTPEQTAAALGSGALTGIIGAGSAGLGGRLGAADIDAMLSGATGPAAGRSMLARLGIGTGMEAGEETLQSSQEQVMQNAALGNPLTQGVGNAAGQGAVLGGLMGGAASLRHPNMTAPQPAPVQQPAQQQQGQAAPAFTPRAMPTPATVPNDVPVESQAPATPYAGSKDLSPLLDNLGLQGEQRARTLDLLQPVESDVEARRRGIVSETEQKRLANLIGLDGAQALAHGRKLGQAFNAEEFRAVTSAVQNQMTSVLEMQQRIASGQASDIDRAQFVDDLANMRRTTGELLGARAEAGRALAAQRRQVADIRQAQAILESVGGVSGADDLATAIGAAIQSGGLQNAAKVIQKGNHITDYIKAGWLSDPTTHLANMAGNTGMLGVNTMDRINAAVLAGGKRLFGLKGETMWSEPVALLSGAIRGQAKAVAATQKAFMEGESPLLGSGKLEASSLPRRTMPGLKGAAKLAFDNTALAPFRFLGAEDAYFAVTQYEASLRALAHRAASAEKKSGTLPQGVKMSQRIEQLVSSPTPAMIEQSGDFARESTFNKRAGPFGSKLLAAKAAVPWLNIVIPFVRTPLAVLERAWKGSPLGLTTRSVWRDIREGGAAQEAAIGKMMTGTQIMIGAGLLAQAGYLTGSGPDDDKERAAWLAAGNQPYSVRLGNTWYGINRLDPFAMWAGSVADLVQTDWKNKDAEHRALKLVSTFADNIVSKTWMSGVEGLSQALADPERYMPTYLQRTGASLLQPYAGLSGIAARQDEFARKPDSLIEAIKVRTPGLRESVPARMDSWGEPIANNRRGDSAFNALAPMTHVEVSTDPVRLEVGRIGWAPGKAQDHFTIKKQRYDLTDKQLDEFNELTGRLMRKSVQRAMQSKGWAAMGDDEKRDFLDAELRKARTAVRVALIPLLATGNRRAIDKLRSATGSK